MSKDTRPLSPHLGVYRWQISNTLSILHRATGVMLSIGAVVLVGWLISIASGYNAYGAVTNLLSGLFGSLMLFGWTFCFFYHLANGIRHLGWDVGYGFDADRARLTGVIVVVVALALTTAFWIVALGARGDL